MSYSLQWESKECSVSYSLQWESKECSVSYSRQRSDPCFYLSLVWMARWGRNSCLGNRQDGLRPGSLRSQEQTVDQGEAPR